MLSANTLVCLLLPVLAGGSTVQQDLLCTDSYTEFESASVGSNVSGSDIRNQLYKVFYAPNQHLPYAVLVTYQMVLANGTTVKLSSDQNCSSELWMWLSSPVFLYCDPTCLGYRFMSIVNYFLKWKAPYIIITTTTAPCHEKIGEFLSEMTASLQDYALGQMEHKTNLGYVKQGCGTSSETTRFSATGKESALIIAVYIIGISGLFFQVMFVWIVSAVLLKMTFNGYAEKTFTYSYDMYGTFWGLSTTALGFLVVLYGIAAAVSFPYFVNGINSSGNVRMSVYILSGALLFILVAELPVAIYTARKATVAVPGIFKYPAMLLCCGRRRRAEYLVTTLALWVDLVALQLVLFQASLIIFAISAAPFTVVTNALLVVLALSCLANIFSLLFTIFAHLFTPADQRVHSSSMVLRAVVVLPLLLMIICYGVVAAFVGSVTNMDAKKNNILSFINSIATPILLGTMGIFLKRFISAWLKWSPKKEAKNETDITRRQETDEELLEP